MLSFTIPGVAGGELVIMEARRITLRHTPATTVHRRTQVFMDRPALDRDPTVAAERSHQSTPSATAAVAVLLPVVIRVVIHAVQAVRLVHVWDRHRLAR